MRSFTIQGCGVVGLILLFMMAATRVARGQYDPAADFSLASNPNGVWSYGFENLPFPNTFNFLPVPVPGAIDSWQAPTFGEVGVFHNGTAVPQNYVTSIDGAVYQPGEIGMHPGPNDQFAVIQFSAPAPGEYMIQGVFEGLDLSNTTNTQVDLLVNNVVVKSGNVIGDGPSSDVPLQFGPVFLNVGDTFAYATGGNPVAGSTGLVPGSAMIEAVPEPAAFAVFGVVAVGLLIVRRRA